MKKIVIVLGLLFFVIAAYSQSGIKFGHINTQDLLAAMPESDSAKINLEKFTKELEGELEVMQVELNKKYQDYLGKRDTYSELIRQTKEQELQEMQQRIQQFQTTAETELQKKRELFFKPVLDKAKKAIEDVSKENKFTYVFDTSAGALIFHSEDSYDVMPLVKKKLGLK